MRAKAAAQTQRVGKCAAGDLGVMGPSELSLYIFSTLTHHVLCVWALACIALIIESIVLASNRAQVPGYKDFSGWASCLCVGTKQMHREIHPTAKQKGTVFFCTRKSFLPEMAKRNGKLFVFFVGTSALMALTGISLSFVCAAARASWPE